jgi:hypothetical protein
MGKLKDLVLRLDFENVPTHTVEFDPNADTVELDGRDGKYDAMRVVENGKPAFLSLSNQSLIRQLQDITEPCRLKLTREGTSYATKYRVERVK